MQCRNFSLTHYKFAINNDLSWKLTHIESGITTSSTGTSTYSSPRMEVLTYKFHLPGQVFQSDRKQFESINTIVDNISCSDQMDGITLEAEYTFPLNLPIYHYSDSNIQITVQIQLHINSITW